MHGETLLQHFITNNGTGKVQSYFLDNSQFYTCRLSSSSIYQLRLIILEPKSSPILLCSTISNKF